MADLTPRTRSESFLNGEDLEPITRREHFYAGRENELPEGHQEPETREEWFIKKYREAGDVTVESLSITENGTYTAPSGKAYSPVSVNVPLPSNAYLLKSIEHESIAAFTDGTDNFLKSLEVAIEPVQSGSGDPSPTNIRPISGWDEVNVSVSGVNVWDEEWEVGSINDVGDTTSSIYRFRSKNYISCKPSTRYYLKDGSLAIARIFYYDKNQQFISFIVNPYNAEFETPSNCYYLKFRTKDDFTTYNHDISINYPSTDTSYHAYNGHTYTIDLDGTRYGGKLDVVNGIVTPAPYYASYNGEALTGEWISDRDKYEVGATPTIGAQVVNIGASDTPVSIAPTIIKSLQGDNNFFADTGEIELLQYWGEVS